MATRNDNGPEGPRQTGQVVSRDGSWEDALRAGQRADGGAGSVDAELSVIHLLRHARAPQTLADDRLDALWGELDAGLTEAAGPAAVRWWKRPWAWAGGVGLAAAAAAVVLVVVLPQSGPPSDGAVAQQTVPAAKTTAQTLEQQFALLAPAARANAAVETEQSRSTLRGNLLADAAGAASASQEGAP